MKKLLLSFAILSLVLSTQAGASTDLDNAAALAASVATATTQVATATTQVAVASDLRLRPGTAQPVAVQLVGIGENRSDQRVVRSATSPRADTQDRPPPVDGLPSTPVALGALLLLLCMLIGRRNG